MRPPPAPLDFLLLCTWLLLVSTAAAGATDGLVVVPSGVTSVVLGKNASQLVSCSVAPHSSVRLQLALVDGDGSPSTHDEVRVSPRTLLFANDDAAVPQLQTRAFTLAGRAPGRFYLTYTLAGDDASLYRLSAASSVISVSDDRQGWQGLWYELGVNVALFAAGAAFFVWRRMHRLELPIWKGHHAGLFERANYDLLDPAAFRDTYREILGGSVRERMRRFVALGAHDAYVCHTCGIPAALNLQFHADAGHLFAVLSLFSVAVLLPVNYVSGKSVHGDSFQQTTFSNVPLHSEWYWAHVAYCYLVAGCVLVFILRQSQLSSTLQKRTKRIVGARSLLIRHGLPPTVTSKTLRAMLSECFPKGVDEVTVIDDLTHVHAILHRRRELSSELERMRLLDASYEHGAMSWNLLLCPGSVLLPSPIAVVSSYLCCTPCRYAWRHEQVSRCLCPAHRHTRLRPHYSSVKSDREILDPRARHAIQSLDEELDFFPEEAIRVYNNRQCIGAAFVVFESTAARNAFVRFVHAHSCVGRVYNALESCSLTSKGDAGSRGAGSAAESGVENEATALSPTMGATSAATSGLAPYLSKLVLESAPEPDDIIWTNIEYRPYSFTGVVGFLLRQVATVALLLLFSSPTAVLVYVKLDSDSALYDDLASRHSFLATLLVSYLPSLLLIAVNWLLLAFLYYVTMTEPTISESRRTNIFLVKGFVYLVLSSVLLPSIGITAVYLAVSGIGDGGATYIESFLYKVSGTFFLSYVLQRTFLGAILDITRSAERFAYQPWVLARSVTDEEKKFSMKPWPFFYGHDYALILSVFMMVLLGSVMTPIITPFGALYFYLKYATTKYNFLYVMPFSPGRGHIAQTAVTIAFACLVGFEFMMTFVLLQVAGRRHFVAMVVLLSLTGGFYFMRISGMTAIVERRLSDRRRGARQQLVAAQTPPPPRDTSYSSPSGAKGRPALASASASASTELARKKTYTDPYKVALSIFKLLGVNQFHRMTSRRTQLIYAFYRLRRHAQMKTAGIASPAPSPPRLLRVADERAEEEDLGTASQGDLV
ncbi:hypothetical protein PybrP1_005759 [[Pythium] brassicae (nom. inval.)]|nr:hypothetical protein PybrP1_005759 [[Pythium] brassicae (nom. inval.)]